MDFKNIQYFLHISECNSFTEASEQLFISQQALSKSVKNLEQELGVRLFDRSVSGIKLTSDGVYLRSKFAPIYAQYQEALNDSLAHFHAKKDVLEFAVCPGFFRSIPATLLLDYQKKYPNCKLKQVEMNDLDCEEYVHRDPHNIAFSTRPTHMSGLDYQSLHREKLYLIASNTHPLAGTASVKISQLKNDNFLIVNDRFNIHHLVKQICKENGFVPNIAYDSADVSLLLRLASEGIGVFICVAYVFSESNFKNLVCIPLSDDDAYFDIGLVTQANRSLDRDIRQFIDYMSSQNKINP